MRPWHLWHTHTDQSGWRSRTAGKTRKMYVWLLGELSGSLIPKLRRKTFLYLHLSCWHDPHHCEAFHALAGAADWSPSRHKLVPFKWKFIASWLTNKDLQGEHAAIFMSLMKRWSCLLCCCAEIFISFNSLGFRALPPHERAPTAKWEQNSSCSRCWHFSMLTGLHRTCRNLKICAF